MQKKLRGVFVISFVFLTALTGCGGGGGNLPPEQMPAFSPVSPPEAEKAMQQAEKAYSSGKIPEAISVWEKVARKFPNTASAAKALNRIGEIYLAQGQPDRAEQYFEYLVYAYPGWEGVVAAKLNELRVLAQSGKQKQVMKDAVPLWEAAAGRPDVRIGLARLMIGIYAGEGDIETAFDWSVSGFSAAGSPEEKRELSKLTVEFLSNADEGVVRKLYKKNPSDFMRAFIDYRYARIEMEKGQVEMGQQRLKAILAKNADHPLAPEIRAALRGAKVEAGPAAEGSIPLNSDRIGVLVPLNGANAKYGAMIVRGLNMAISEWNAKSPDHKITLVIRDAGSEPASAVASYRELTQKEGVLAIIGPLGIQAAKEVMPLANRDGVPLLALTQKEDAPSEQTFVLHLLIDSRALVRSLVRYCREKLKYERFACLYPDDRYGQKLAKIFSETVQEQGGTILASASYKERSTDFTEPLQKLLNIAKKNSPVAPTEGTPFEALFIPDQVQAVSLIAPQLPYNNIVGVTLLGTNLWSEAPLVQAGGVYVEHALFATSFYAESQNPRVKAFREKFESLYNAPPSYLEAQAYDALMLLLQSRQAAGTPISRDSVFQVLLHAKGFKAVAGNYTVNANGELERQYNILQVVNGQLTQVYP